MSETTTPQAPTPGTRTAWFRSLYWRIALGFVAMLAILLLVQGALFLWLTARYRESVSSRSPQELADLVARDLSDALADDPALDLQQFVHERFDDVGVPFAVVLRDGRRAFNRPAALPPQFAERVRARLIAPRGAFGPPPGGRGRNAAPPGWPAPRPPDGNTEAGAGGAGSAQANEADTQRPRPRRRGGRGGVGAGVHLAPVVVQAALAGHVAVPAGVPETGTLLRELGPTLTWSGLALLGIGSAALALVVFRPARRRLRSLEAAARALGQGRTEARADESGGDEVSTLARAFNQMAAELDARAAALAAADRTRRQLLADVSHELMTPLTAIRGYTETLAMAGLSLDEATRRRYLAIVEEETHTLEAIIGDLLDLARLEGGGAALALEHVPVVELFGRVRDRHAPALQARGIRLEMHAPETLAVDGDPQRLEQALQNVASNAIRHTPDGGVISLEASEDGDHVMIAVRDTGPGIPPEHLPRIFDRFYKVDASRTTTGAPAGSGLGLSIVRAIVERHGGSVRAANAAAGGGARFELVLPKRAARAAT